MYNTKNYMEQGGNKWVVGGTLEIKENATVTGSLISQATSSLLGGVKASNKTDNETVEAKIGTNGKLYVPAVPQATTQADSTATDVAGVVADLNALISKLKTAGLMANE